MSSTGNPLNGSTRSSSTIISGFATSVTSGFTSNASGSANGSTTMTSRTARGRSSTSCVPATLPKICATALPKACADMNKYNGVALIPMIPLCTASLSAFRTVDTAACLAANIGATATGASITSCLQKAISAICITSLPQACISIPGSSAVDLPGKITACTTALGPFVVDAAAQCLKTALSDPVDILSCLQSSIGLGDPNGGCWSGQPTVSSTASSLTTTTISSTNVPTSTTASTTISPNHDLEPPPPTPSSTRPIPSSCPTPTCDKGIQYALYNNPFRGDTTRKYNSFNPNYFKKTLPKYNSTLHTPVYISDQGLHGFNQLFKNAAAGYRGFLYACKAGNYSFSSPYADDITLMWFGSKAISGYARDNADIDQTYYGVNKPQNITKTLEAGTYYPFRVLWGNTGYAAYLSLRIYGPDGQQLSGTDQAGEFYITTKACDGSYGPFEPWGQES
ncbi:hypothetical protein NLG97_g3543 [Lecanicillium saksenae]|uniref:Uncharacterized protein n=1 Tax=Lecanicillium saksenae TaxID=468837 RepID=A0ACC1QXX2_9HYPO|nr:hypothetical protein NLG97_g3543 [Lecanicillium saksenae]